MDENKANPEAVQWFWVQASQFRGTLDAASEKTVDTEPVEPVSDEEGKLFSHFDFLTPLRMFFTVFFF